MTSSTVRGCGLYRWGSPRRPRRMRGSPCGRCGYASSAGRRCWCRATAPDPVPGPGQVLIEVAHANITFVETQLRAGRLGPFRVTLPLIPGNGVGGMIAAVGPDVDPALVGRRVVSGHRRLRRVRRTGGGGRGRADRGAGRVGAGRRGGAAGRRAHRRYADRRGRRAPGRTGAGGGRGGRGGQPAGAARGTGRSTGGRRGRRSAQGGPGAASWAPRWRSTTARRTGPTGCGPPSAGWTWCSTGSAATIGRAAFELLDRGGRMVSFGLASGEWAAVPTEAAAARGVTLVRLDAAPARMRASPNRRWRRRRPDGCGR